MSTELTGPTGPTRPTGQPVSAAEPATAPPAAPRPPTWRVASNCPVPLADGREVSLRPLAVADAARLAGFFAALTERETYYFFPLDEASARQLALEVDQAAAYRLVAVAGEREDDAEAGRIVGYMFLRWSDAETAEYGACLLPEAQSGGLGRAMIRHLLDSAAASGVDRVYLTVHTDNWRALRLYQGAGFRLTGEFINRSQRVKQYRMEADLRQPPPPPTAAITVIPRGGLGVGVPAAQLQAALTAALGHSPLILDRPAGPDSLAVYVADLGPAPAALPPPSFPVPPAAPGAGWIVALDDRHLLVAGGDPAGVERAARRYAELVAAALPGGCAGTSADAALARLPFAGLRELL